MRNERLKSWWLAGLFLLAVQVAAHAQAVDLILEVSDGDDTTELHFGLDPAASEGIDAAPPLNEVEVPPLPPAGVFEARFIDTDIPITGLGQGVYRDFRNCTAPCASFSGTQVHEVRFQRGTGENTTLSWDLPANVTGTLQDIFGGALVNEPMTGTGSFTVPIPGLDRLIMTIVYEPAVTPEPEIEVNPASHDYGDVAAGSSASQTFVVSNTGAANLEVSATSLTGADAGDFSIDSGAGAFTLAPGATHNIDVSFNPGTEGARAATLRIESNDADEATLDVPLSGNGVVPDIDIAPASHNYGNVTVGSSASQTFVVSNEGGAELQVSATTLEGADAGAFSIDSGAGAFTLAPGATHNIDVSFNPAVTGGLSATLRIQSNDPDEDPFDVPLSGTGTEVPVPDIAVAPSSHDYGSVTLGSSASQTFVVSNEGTADLDVSGASLTGADAGDFSIDSGGGAFTLAPGATHNIEVSFTPGTAGARAATLRIESNDPDEDPFDVALSGEGTEAPVPPDIAVNPSSHDYGTVTVGSSASQTFVVSNEGGLDLEVSATSLTGADAGDFSIDSGGGAFTLAGGATHDVEVSCNPSSDGTRSAVLRIESNDPDEDPFDVALTCTGETVVVDTTPPVCVLDRIDKNAPVTLYVNVSDDGSGLQSINVVTSTNAVVSWDPFTEGTTDVIEVRGVKQDQAQPSVVVLEVFDVAGNSTRCDPIMKTLSAELPDQFALGQNYPNPFNPTTTIRFQVAEQSPVLLQIYDLVGREVVTLVNQPMEAGTYQVQWNGRDAGGQLVPSGVYVYRMEAGTFSETKRLMLLK